MVGLCAFRLAAGGDLAIGDTRYADARAEEEAAAKAEPQVQGFEGETADSGDRAESPVDRMNASLASRLNALDAQRARDTKAEEREATLTAAMTEERREQERSRRGYSSADLIARDKAKAKEADRAAEAAQKAKAKGGEEPEGAETEGVLGMPMQGEATVDPEVAAKIQEVIDSADESYEGPRRKEVIGPVSEEVAAVVAEALGIDATGYKHSIDTNAVKHIFERHGRKREKRERARGQIPITPEDIKHIPSILASPDRVDYTGKTDRGYDSFMYRKRMPDGTVFYLEEVHSKNGELAAKTLYKKENPAGENVPVANHSPFPNVRNGSGVVGKGTQQDSLVNGQEEGLALQNFEGKNSGSLSLDTANGKEVLGSPLGLGRTNAQATSFEGESGALAQRKGRPVTAPEVFAALAEVIETVGGSAKGMNRTGRIRGRKYAGVYLVREKITRIKESNNVGTAAHELAHAIDGQLWNYGHWAGNALGLSDGARRELHRLSLDRLFSEVIDLLR